MDFNPPSTAELAYSSANDASRKIAELEKKLRDMNDRLNGLSFIQTAIEERLDKLEKLMRS